MLQDWQRTAAARTDPRLAVLRPYALSLGVRRRPFAKGTRELMSVDELVPALCPQPSSCAQVLCATSV